MEEYLLHKYIRNAVDPDEKERILHWIKEHPENQERYNALKAQYVVNTLKNVKDGDDGKAFGLFKKKQMASRQWRYASYAMVTVILFLVGLFFYSKGVDGLNGAALKNNLGTVIVRNNGEAKKAVLLPDGSTVQLNIDSRVEYPTVFRKDSRTVSLVGEALFDIVHDSLRPFIVKTQDFDVKVLGTVFNVKSYLNDTQTETTLISGKVELLRERETPIILAPSQKAVFNKVEKKIEIEKVVSDDVIAWQKGTLVFKRTPMQQVVLDLERKYDVKITINSPKLLKYEYTGTFDNLTVEESLHLLMMSSPIKYQRENKEIILDMKE